MKKNQILSLDPMKQLDEHIFAVKDSEVIYATDFINHLVTLVLDHASSNPAKMIKDNKAS